MVDIFIDVFNFIFTVILVGVFLAWLSLLSSMYQSFTKTPFLDIFENKSTTTPKVSVILPARNEEEFISKCLETLGSQDYENFEIIAIDDSSEDKTGEIIEKFSKETLKNDGKFISKIFMGSTFNEIVSEAKKIFKENKVFSFFNSFNIYFITIYGGVWN